MRNVLLVDFGSTYTKVTAVDLEREELLGHAQSWTTVDTDINEGLEKAVAKLEEITGKLEYEAAYACSSAAGGLRMLVSGLVPALTAEAARRASLGAGAKIVKTYSYGLTEEDGEDIVAQQPDIFLLAGGIDGGNTDCIIGNAKVLAAAGGDFPILIAGNRNAAAECERILAGREIYRCENVMPRLGELRVEGVQERIREVFLRKIVQAKGLDKAQRLLDGVAMPTPAAVMEAIRLLSEGTENEKGIGDLIAVDVGGATTDVYSVARGEPTRANTIMKGLPEPYLKRTVEGDIGMRYSVHGIMDAATPEGLAMLAGMDTAEVRRRCDELRAHTDAVPQNEADRDMDYALASAAVSTGVTRHAGRVEETFTALGRTWLQTGKDLGDVERIVLTGGSLIHTDRAREIASHAMLNHGDPMALRPKRAEVLVDRKYILAAMGLLSQHEADIALRIMKKELVSDGTAE